MVSVRIFRKLRVAAPGVTALVWGSAFAGQPLVLDTQQGISDGRTGTVLQTAPLSPAPMVEAKRPAAPAGLAADPAPPLIVAPYIEAPGGGARPGKPARLPSSPRPPAQPTQQ